MKRFTDMVLLASCCSCLSLALKLPEDRWTDVNRETDRVGSSLDKSTSPRNVLGVRTSVTPSMERGLSSLSRV